MISGQTFGAPYTRAGKHIKPLWGVLRDWKNSSGFGRVPIEESTNFFFLLLLLDRLNTRNILQRKHMHLPILILCLMQPKHGWNIGPLIF
jgi:hypothetical protein